MKKKLVYLYRWIMWNVLSRPFVFLYIKPTYRFTRTPGSRPFPRPPFVVIANHGTFFDPWMCGVYSRYPFAIMCNDDGFRGSPLARWYLNSIGAFPKKKGASDFAAMKTTIARMRDGYPVCIFPEGQTTWDGETQLMYKGIERIIRKARCPLVTIRLQGNFLTRPWWARTPRKGRILLTIKVIAPEEIARLSDDGLFSLMKNSIYQDDIRDEMNRAATFSGHDLALGLERFVWICMTCGAEDRLETAGDRITCRACGACFRLDAHCRLKPEPGTAAACLDIKEWWSLHRRTMIDRIAAATPHEVLARSPRALLQTMGDRAAFVNRGAGELSLTREQLAFRPDDRQSAALCFPLPEIRNWVIQRKDIFEVTARGVDYRFEFNRESPMKWLAYMRYLKGYEECERRGWIE